MTEKVEPTFHQLTKSEQRTIELRVRAALVLMAEAQANLRAAEANVQAEKQGALDEVLGYACDRLVGLEEKLEELRPEWKFVKNKPVGFRLVPRETAAPKKPDCGCPEGGSPCEEPDCGAAEAKPFEPDHLDARESNSGPDGVAR